MNLSSITSKLSRVIDELKRPNLTTEDKGRLVLVKDELTKAMTVEETAAIIDKSALSGWGIDEVKALYAESGIAESEASEFDNGGI